MGPVARFAGSGDRAAIAGLVYDALRRKASSAWLMDADTPRARALGMLMLERGSTPKRSERSRRRPLRARAAERSRAGAPASPLARRRAGHVAGDYPEWLDAHLAATFGEIASRRRRRWPRARRSICASTR